MMKFFHPLAWHWEFPRAASTSNLSFRSRVLGLLSCRRQSIWLYSTLKQWQLRRPMKLRLCVLMHWIHSLNTASSLATSLERAERSKERSASVLPVETPLKICRNWRACRLASSSTQISGNYSVVEASHPRYAVRATINAANYFHCYKLRL